MQTLTPTRPPRQHQMEALKQSKGKRNFFYLCEMGLGKSKIAIDEFLELYLIGEIDQVLIVAGKGSYADWLHKHLPENVPEDIHVVAHLWAGGTTKAEQADLRGLMYRPPPYGTRHPLRVLIMNVEAFGASKTAASVANNFVQCGHTLIVCDESTKIRNMSAARTKVMVALGLHAKYRRAMTGMATPKNPLDLWGQMMFLGLSHVLGQSWYAFRAQYCTMVTHEHHVRGAKQTVLKKSQKIVGYKNLGKLQELMRPHSFRALKEDCLDLPPKIYEQVVVELSDRQKAAYRNMLKLSMHELEAGVYVSAVNVVSRINKLHQISCGFVVDEAGVTHELDSNRMDALDDTINEMTGKVIIWCAYQHDVVTISKHLRVAYPDHGAVIEYYGPTPPAARAEGVKAFQSGSAGFFVGTASTGGFGITLTACHNVIYFSNSFDLEYRLQSEDRCHRDGTTRVVTYVDLIAKGTVDRKILQALIEKKNVADVVMGDGVREWLKLD